MEAAALFTVAALRGVEAACLLTVSDIVVEGEFKRISDEEMRAAVDRMTKLAHSTSRSPGALSALDRVSAVFLVNPASANGSTAKRWPKLRERARELGLEGDELLSERPGHLTELAREAAGEGKLIVVVGGDGTMNEVVNGLVGAGAEIAVLPNGTGQDFGRTHGIPTKFDDAVAVALTGDAARGRPRPGRVRATASSAGSSRTSARPG